VKKIVGEKTGEGVRKGWWRREGGAREGVRKGWWRREGYKGKRK
jgi:hypothetical protein